MRSGLDPSGPIDGGPASPINRRVATMSGCEFRRDPNAAASSEPGVSGEKMLALDGGTPRAPARGGGAPRPGGVRRPRAAFTDRDVDDEPFSRLRGFFDDDALVWLAAAIAWGNPSSEFDRATRLRSRRPWRGSGGSDAEKRAFIRWLLGSH